MRQSLDAVLASWEKRRRADPASCNPSELEPYRPLVEEELRKTDIVLVQREMDNSGSEVSGWLACGEARFSKALGASARVC